MAAKITFFNIGIMPADILRVPHDIQRTSEEQRVRSWREKEEKNLVLFYLLCSDSEYPFCDCTFNDDCNEKGRFRKEVRGMEK